MPPKSIRERLAEQNPEERVQKSYDTKDSGNFKGIWKDNLPFPIRSMKTGEYNADIIPYLAGANDPVIAEGKKTYVCDVQVHGGVGPRKDRYICPASFKVPRPCPVCEERERLKDSEDADEKQIKSMYPSRRGLYFMIFYDNPTEEKKGVQVVELSHHLFEKLLVAQAKLSTKDQTKLGMRFQPFANETKKGKTVNWEQKGEKLSKKIESLTFSDRDYDIPEEWLVKCSENPLDSLIHFADYDEIKKALDAGESDSDDDGEEEAPEEKKEVKEEPKKEKKTKEEGKKKKTKEEKPAFEIPADCKDCFGKEWDEYDSCGTCPITKQCEAKQKTPEPEPEKEEEAPPAKQKKKLPKEEKKETFEIPDSCKDCFGKEYDTYEECAKCSIAARCKAVCSGEDIPF